MWRAFVVADHIRNLNVQITSRGRRTIGGTRLVILVRHGRGAVAGGAIRVGLVGGRHFSVGNGGFGLEQEIAESDRLRLARQETAQHPHLIAVEIVGAAAGIHLVAALEDHTDGAGDGYANAGGRLGARISQGSRHLVGSVLAGVGVGLI